MLQAVAQPLIHMPDMVRRLEKTKFSGARGATENLRVVNRVDAVEAARPHVSTRVGITFRHSRGGCGEDDGCGESNLGLGRHLASPWLVCCLSSRMSDNDERGSKQARAAAIFQDTRP
jgi:hypothetical protein